MRIRSKPILSILILSLFAKNVLPAEPEKCTTLRIADIGWTDNIVINALATTVAQNLGYKVVETTASVPITMIGLRDGQLDAFIDDWSPSADQIVLQFKDRVSIQPQSNMDGAKFTLAVPQYLYDQGLQSFSDVARFKEQLGGKIYGIEPGSGGNKHIKEMIDKNLFNLGDFKLIESSEAAMLVQVRRAVNAKGAVVFLGWAPHPMNLQIKMAYLKGGDPVFGPDYGAARVYTIVSKSFESTCPNASRFVKQLRFTPEMEATLMLAVVEKHDLLDAAKGYLKNNSEVLDGWLSGVTTTTGADGLTAVRNALGVTAK